MMPLPGGIELADAHRKTVVMKIKLIGLMLALAAVVGCAGGSRNRGLAGDAAGQGAGRTLVSKLERGGRLEAWEVAELSRHGMADERLIAYLERKKSVYLVSEAQARMMRDAGVAGVVVDYLQESPNKLKRRNYPKGYIPPGVCRPGYRLRYGQ